MVWRNTLSSRKPINSILWNPSQKSKRKSSKPLSPIVKTWDKWLSSLRTNRSSQTTHHHQSASFSIISLHQIKFYVNNRAGKNSLFPDGMPFRTYKFEVLKIFDRKRRGVRNIRLVPTSKSRVTYKHDSAINTDWRHVVWRLNVVLQLAIINR